MSSGIYNDDDADEDLLKLMEEVETMAETLRESRETVPNQLASTFSTLIASQRTVLPTSLLHEDPQPDNLTSRDQGLVRRAETDSMALVVTYQAEEFEKIQVLKQKIESNASKLPIVVNKMKNFMARIDKLESSKSTIHPPYKRRRSSRLNS